MDHAEVFGSAASNILILRSYLDSGSTNYLQLALLGNGQKAQLIRATNGTEAAMFDIALMSDLAKLNSNQTSLKIWTGPVSFVFSNSDTASVYVSSFCSVSPSSIVGCSCIPAGYARATFGFDSAKAQIIMQAHQAYNFTMSVLVTLFYT